MNAVRLSYSDAGGVRGSITHQVMRPQRDGVDLAGKVVGGLVVVGLDLVEGTKVAAPVLTVGGKGVGVEGVTVEVRNGALVVMDPSEKLFVVSESWTLTWGSQEDEVVQGVETVKVASE